MGSVYDESHRLGLEVRVPNALKLLYWSLEILPGPHPDQGNFAAGKEYEPLSSWKPKSRLFASNLFSIKGPIRLLLGLLGLRGVWASGFRPCLP